MTLAVRSFQKAQLLLLKRKNEQCKAKHDVIAAALFYLCLAVPGAAFVAFLSLRGRCGCFVQQFMTLKTQPLASPVAFPCSDTLQRPIAFPSHTVAPTRLSQ